MKLLSFFSVPLLLVTLCSCGKSSAENKNQSPVFSTKEVKFERMADASYGTANVVEISVDYPEGNGNVAVDSVRSWIVSELSAVTGVNLPDSVKSLADGYAIIKTYGNDLLDAAVEEVTEVQTSTLAPVAGYEYNLNISNVFKSPKCVSYTGSCYAFTGGAHGNTLLLTATFNLSDGQRLKWDNMFKPGYETKLITLIRSGLMADYFCAETIKELSDHLFSPAEELPLPTLTPYFTDKGVVFTYSQYEIAPYSEGCPECTISYEDIRPLLSQFALSLID